MKRMANMTKTGIGPKGLLLGALVCISLIALSGGQAHAITVHMSDFIADGTRTNFNGFESIPNDGTFYTGGAGPYVEDGVRVQQIAGDGGNDIWVTFTGGAHQGSYSWYPNGGDSGYTSITMADGSDFGEIGLLAGHGWGGGNANVSYELFDNGASVLTGWFLVLGNSYLGFSDGTFDELRLVATATSLPLPGSIGDGTFQAFAVDSIEVRSSGGPIIPEPSTVLLLGAGLAGLGLWGRKRMKK